MYAACLIGKLGGIEEYGSIMEIKEHYFEAVILSMNINLKVYVNNVSNCNLNFYSITKSCFSFVFIFLVLEPT